MSHSLPSMLLEMQHFRSARLMSDAISSHTMTIHPQIVGRSTFHILPMNAGSLPANVMLSQRSNGSIGESLSKMHVANAPRNPGRKSQRKTRHEILIFQLMKIPSPGSRKVHLCWFHRDAANVPQPGSNTKACEVRKFGESTRVISKLGTAERNEGKRRELGRTKRTKGSQKNRAALVLL